MMNCGCDAGGMIDGGGARRGKRWRFDPVRVEELDPVTSLALGTGTACAQTQPDGDVVCWGGEGRGSCPSYGGTQCYIYGGDVRNTAAARGTLSGVRNAHAPSWVSIARAVGAGPYHHCLVRLDGSVRCWGASVEERMIPSEAMPDEIGVGAAHQCALAGGSLLLGKQRGRRVSVRSKATRRRGE